MATVSTPLSAVARELFAEMGYTVDGDGDQFRALRGWKEVRVTPVEDAGETRETEGDLECFVTWSDRAGQVRRVLSDADPGGEWAVVAVEDDGEYEVVRAPGVT